METCYDFHLNKDSAGNDIGHVPGKNTDELKALCTNNPKCKAFNDWGWLKHTVQPEDKWVSAKVGSPLGFHVKKPCPVKVIADEPVEEEPMSMIMIIMIIVAIILFIISPSAAFIYYMSQPDPVEKRTM